MLLTYNYYSIGNSSKDLVKFLMGKSKNSLLLNLKEDFMFLMGMSFLARPDFKMLDALLKKIIFENKWFERIENIYNIVPLKPSSVGVFRIGFSK